MKTYYIERGEVTCQDVADMWGVDIGAPEYQFSDGPAGQRSMSYDYPSLDAGLSELAPAKFIYNGFVIKMN